MRLRSLVTATALAVALPALTATTASAAAPAHRAAAKVTLKDLPASSEVGQKVKIAGTAKPAGKGKRAKRVKVTVQRSYGAGVWQNVATARTSRSGRYAVKVPLTQGGPTSFRVKRAGGGTTPADSLAVYQWLNLVDVPFLAGGGTVELRRVATIGGQSFPNSIQIPSGGGGVAAKPNGLCTTFEVWTGFLDSQRAGLAGTARQVGGMFAAGAATSKQVSVSTPVGPAVRVSLDLTGQRYLLSEMMVSDAPDADLVLASPRLRCNATTIAEMSTGELSL